MKNGLMDALVQAAQGAREDAGVSKERVADKLGKSVDAVRRFEAGGMFAGLDDLMDAYSEATGASLIDLLSEAESTLKKRG